MQDLQGKYSDTLRAQKVGGSDDSCVKVELKPRYVCEEAMSGCEHPKVHPGFVGRPYRYCKT